MYALLGQATTRREFIRRLTLVTPALFSSWRVFQLSRSVSAGPRESGKVFIEDGRSLLVVVEGTDLRSMLRAGIGALPAFDEAVRDRERIVIKPNATAAQPYPVTTDVQLVKTLIEVIRQHSQAKITVCDSPSYAGLAAHRVFSTLGYFDLRGPGVSVRCIDPTIGSHFIEVSKSSWTRHAKLLTTKLVQQADLVINLAVPKRHHAADFSCALKNNMGYIYDTFRMLAHLDLATDSHTGTGAFDLSVVEFADAVRPELTIVDASA